MRDRAIFGFRNKAFYGVAEWFRARFKEFGRFGSKTEIRVVKIREEAVDYTRTGIE